MNRLLPSLLALGLCLQGHAQTPYEVTYQTQTEAQTLYLLDVENRQVLDSARVTNKQAIFRGQVAQPLVAAISSLPRLGMEMTPLLLDGQALTLNSDGAGTLSVQGSTPNQRYAAYLNQVNARQAAQQALKQEYRQLAQEHKGQVPDTTMARIETAYEALADDIKQATQDLLQSNKDNLAPLLPLLTMSDFLGYDYVEQYLQDYTYANRESLAELKAFIAKEKSKRPGARVLELTLPNLEGQPVNLTDYVGKGQYVLVDFWASWCGPCRQEMPTVVAAYQRYHSKGFEVVGISLDKQKEAWTKAVKDMQMTWPQMSDLKGWQSEAASAYNIRSIPTTILYGPDGTVLATNLRGQELLARLAAIFGE